jgi:hypothetical protein
MTIKSNPMKNMKGLVISAVGFLAVVLPALSLAAGVTLTNGGLGQVAGNASSFGVAVCDGGKSALTASVPVSVTANGVSISTNSASNIAAGACEYTYVPYSQFNMQAGNTYTVNVTIDSNHATITNTNNQTSYSVTVPSSATAAGTADVSAQSGNIFTSFWHWLTNLF